MNAAKRIRWVNIAIALIGGLSSAGLYFSEVFIPQWSMTVCSIILALTFGICIVYVSAARHKIVVPKRRGEKIDEKIISKVLVPLNYVMTVLFVASALYFLPD